MSMSEELDKLKALQDILAKKYEIEAKVAELPKSLDGKAELLERLNKEYILKNEEFEEEKKKVAVLKEELEEVQKLCEESEKGMDAQLSHREFEILDKQISEAQEREAAVRKNLTREEKILSELNDVLKEKEALIASTTKDSEEAKSVLSEEMDELSKELEGLSEEEAVASEGIDEETIIKFQRIIKRNSKGIVAVRGNVCDGCHMILPAQFANEIHKGESILFCPYCSRILFYEETGDEEASFYSLEGSGSLVDDDDDSVDSLTDEDQTQDDDDTTDSKSMDYDIGD